MSDRAYWPEGVERCSVGKFLAWLGVISIFLAWGGYGAFKVLGTGIGVTGLDNYFGFGLWITFDLAVIALGAGAFFSGFLRYIIRIDELKNIINLAVIVGFLCYSGAMLALINCMNKLYAADTDLYSAVREKYSDGMLRDLSDYNAYWAAFEGPVEEKVTKINDNYLKFNEQEHGVQSYGMMVDLLLAYEAKYPQD